LRIDLADADFSAGSLITEVPIGGDVAAEIADLNHEGRGTNQPDSATKPANVRPPV
jgi:hypothetical protein